MSRRQALAVLFGVCLIAAPFLGVKASDDEYDDDDLDDESLDAGDFNEDKVVVLTTSTFDSILKKHQYALVEFYAPWCGHCKKLAPEYAGAAETLSAEMSEVLVAKVDATVETELAERFGVQGYPTLKWFVNGGDSEYTGGRDEDSIVKWVKKKTGPPAATISSIADLRAQEEVSEVVVVGYFARLDDKDAAYTTFTQVASAVEDATFVQTTSAEVAKGAGLESPGSVAVIKNFDGEEMRSVAAFKGKLDEESLTKFVNAEKLPLTIEFASDNTDRIFNSGIDRHLLFVADAADMKADSPALTVFKEVATAFKGEFVFVTVTADGEEGEPVIKFFELEGEKMPVLVAFEMEPKQRKFRYTGEFTAADIQAFAESVRDGKIEPEYKSEPIPEDDLDGHVKIVVGKSFDDVVKDPSKDVLLEVYAPWCGHCKELAPIYKKLAKRFRDVESVVIAKLDGTENEHPDLEVEGFPTLVFYPAAEGAEAVPFEGERTLKEMTKFIKEHAVIPYQLKKKEKKEEEDDAKDEL